MVAETINWVLQPLAVGWLGRKRANIRKCILQNPLESALVPTQILNTEMRQWIR